MWKRRVSILLFLVFSSQLFCSHIHSLDLTEVELQEILSEAESIRGELNALKINLSMLETMSKTQRKKLRMLEARLQKVLQLLDKSKADLIQSSEELKIVKTELETLKSDIAELNRLYLKQRREKIVWMTTAISVGLVFVGFIVYKEVRK